MIHKDFKVSIQNGDFERVYLFYGEERYLAHYYIETLTAALSKPDVFDGKVDTIISAADTLPFLSEKRFVLVRDSKLFTTGRKAESDAMAEYLPTVPDSTVLAFVESEVDRRGRMYKRAMELGCVVECVTPSPQALTEWLVQIFKDENKTIRPDAANLLIRYGAHNMTTISQEAKKLSAYVGPRQDVTIKDLEAICSPTLQSRVFDMLSAMGNGRMSEALTMYQNMLLMKEQPLMILAMIIRQFRIMLQVKAARDKGMSIAQTAKTLGLRGFVVDEALNHAKRFSIQQLFHALVSCQDTDINIKSGLITAEIGVELLILEYGQVA